MPDIGRQNTANKSCRVGPVRGVVGRCLLDRKVYISRLMPIRFELKEMRRWQREGKGREMKRD